MKMMMMTKVKEVGADERTDGRTDGVIERTEGYMEVWSNKPIERL